MQKFNKMPDIRFAQVAGKAHLIPQSSKAGLDSRRNLRADCAKSQITFRLGSASLSLVGTPRCGVRTAQRAVPTFKYYLRLRARTTVTKNTGLNFAPCL